MNKGTGSQQAQLRHGWYKINDIEYEQPMLFQDLNRQMDLKKGSKSIRRAESLAS